MKKIVVLFLLVLFPLNVLADDFAVSCDKTDKINVGDEIVCRVSTNSDFLYNRVVFDMLENDGLEIVDIRSNDSKKWSLTNSDNTITASASESQTGLQEFGIILLKAVKSGVYDLNFDNISLVNTFTNATKEMMKNETNIKIISSDNLLNGIFINDKAVEDFDSNIVSYDYEITDDETIKIAVESSNEFAIIDGAGEFKLSEKISSFIFPITVMSESGDAKVYIINVKRSNFVSNGIDKTLDSIVIKNDKGNDLIINFDKNTYEYNLDVDVNTTYLKIKPTLGSDNLSFVKNYGEQKIELNPGTNVAIIKVQDEEGEVVNYVINITKPIADKSSNNYLKSLTIKKYKLGFSKKVKNYTLEINASDSKLDITPVLEDENASYIITGNSNLKNGSVIKIIVTAENEEKMVYKINITVKKTNYLLYIILFLGLGLILYVLVSKYGKLISKNKKKTNLKNSTNQKVINSKNKQIKNSDVNKQKNKKVENQIDNSKPAAKVKSDVKNKTNNTKSNAKDKTNNNVNSGVKNGSKSNTKSNNKNTTGSKNNINSKSNSTTKVKSNNVKKTKSNAKSGNNKSKTSQSTVKKKSNNKKKKKKSNKK